MKAILYDPSAKEIIEEVEVLSKEPIEGMYYKTNKGIIPIAYLFDPKHRKEIEILLLDYKQTLNELHAYETKLFYKLLPLFRI